MPPVTRDEALVEAVIGAGLWWLDVKVQRDRIEAEFRLFKALEALREHRS